MIVPNAKELGVGMALYKHTWVYKYSLTPSLYFLNIISRIGLR